jgi:hypothetical protein
VEPVRVCDVLADPTAFRGKAVAVVGRYSYRQQGRYLSEEACESAPGVASPRSVRLAEDSAAAPRLPEGFDIDPAAAARKLRETRKATALGKFRFGSLDYDRWAIVWGRVEPSEGTAAARSPLEPAAMRLVYRGDGVIFFIASE